MKSNIIMLFLLLFCDGLIRVTQAAQPQDGRQDMPGQFAQNGVRVQPQGGQADVNQRRFDTRAQQRGGQPGDPRLQQQQQQQQWGGKFDTRLQQRVDPRLQQQGQVDPRLQQQGQVDPRLQQQGQVDPRLQQQGQGQPNRAQQQQSQQRNQPNSDFDQQNRQPGKRDVQLQYDGEGRPVNLQRDGGQQARPKVTSEQEAVEDKQLMQSLLRGDIEGAKLGKDGIEVVPDLIKKMSPRMIERLTKFNERYRQAAANWKMRQHGEDEQTPEEKHEYMFDDMLSFILPPKAEAEFFQEASENTKYMRISYISRGLDRMWVEVEVKSPQKEVVGSQQHYKEGQVEVEVRQAGEYSIKFRNPQSVDIKVSFGLQTSDGIEQRLKVVRAREKAITDSGALEPVVETLSRVENVLADIRKEQRYSSMQEAEDRLVQENTDSRVFLYSLAESMVFVVAAYFQNKWVMNLVNHKRVV
eukprot:1011022_1